MLYLVHPDLTMEWVNYFDQKLVDEVTANGSDLGTLENWWEPAEGRASDLVLSVALRHGTASAAGIVVPAIHIALAKRPGELDALAHESERVRREAEPTVRAVDEFIDSQSPGWIERGRKIEQGVDDSMAAARAEAAEEAREVLAAPVDPDLLRHWVSLGGPLPVALS